MLDILRTEVYNIIKGKEVKSPVGKKKKPSKNVEDIKTIVEILAGLANVALVIYTISKG